MEHDFLHHQLLKPHCQKCGRRRRKHPTNDSFKFHQQQQRLFPTQYPMNINHCRSDENNILIDQLIEVQQLSTPCSSRRNDHSKDLINRKRVQQMIYLRENINNSNYREIYFPNQYIIQRRLEEKSLDFNQNRFRVDHHFRPLKLQYQTVSTLVQNIPILSFTYSEKNVPVINTALKQDSSLPTDSLTNIVTDQKYQCRNYSTNAIPSIVDIDPFTFQTAVIVDVRKCSQISLHHSHASLSNDNQSDLFSVPISNQQSNKIFLPYSKNSNYDSPLHRLPVVDDVIRNDLSGDYSTHKDLSSTTSTIDINNISIKYAKTLDKLKNVLNIVQQYFFNVSNEIDRSVAETMTPDSLINTYSVAQSIHNQSAIDVENEISPMEVDSLNKNSYSDRCHLRNPAKNINYNQQLSDDEETEHSIPCRSRASRFAHRSAPSMSPSFMLILQTLLVLCLVNRILLCDIFGIVSTDSLVSSISLMIDKKTQEEIVSQNKDKSEHFFLSFFNLL